ncbi:MAG: 2-oxoacid:acceptor oxidoreductase family protein [bacterium]
MLEIRWHGRGGQGVVTAAKLLAESAITGGKYVQANPEYGAERMGAPIRAFTRIDTVPINIHNNIENPHVVVVLDSSLIGAIDVIEGLKEDGIIIINTPHSPKDMRERLKLQGRKIFTVDATKISIEGIKKPIPNTPMVGALVRATGILSIEVVVKDFREKYSRKFRPEILEGNILSIRRAYQEVKGEQ